VLSLYFEEYEYLSFRVIQSSVASNGTLERDTLSEAAVSLRTMVMFVTWSSSGTEFLGKELFYDSDDIFVDVLFKRLRRRKKVVALFA